MPWPAVAAGPYGVRLGRGGGRERKSDGVAWLGLDRGAGRLIETAEAVAARCPAGVSLGAPPKRAPSAHLTVVRHADAAVIESLRARSCGPLGVEWRVDRIVLMRSHLDPGGANYETLHESAM